MPTNNQDKKSRKGWANVEEMNDDLKMSFSLRNLIPCVVLDDWEDLKTDNTENNVKTDNTKNNVKNEKTENNVKN